MKSLHQSGMAGWTDSVAWAIQVEIVVLWICSPFSQACRLFSQLEIFRSASRPSHHRRYH